MRTTIRTVLFTLSLGYRSLRAAVYLAAMGALAACESSLMPRTADTAPPKKWGVDVNMNLFALAASEAHVREPTGRERTFRGAGGSVDETGGAMAPIFPEIVGRWGLTERVEVAAIAGPLRFAAETRLGLLAERRGDAASLALAFAAGYQPFWSRTGPWLRAGFDLSGRVRSLVVMTNIAMTYGSEAHALALGLPGRPEDVMVADAAPQHAQVALRELRLLPGLAIGGGSQSGLGWVGIIPWFTLRAWDLDHASCDGCLPGYSVTAFREPFGASLVVGGAFRDGW